MVENDILAKHRKAENRENPNAFNDWLSKNCHHAVPYEKLRKLSEEKKKILKTIIDEDD